MGHDSLGVVTRDGACEYENDVKSLGLMIHFMLWEAKGCEVAADVLKKHRKLLDADTSRG
jgi:hypothetical protein